MRRLALLLLFATPIFGQERNPLTRGLADSLYCSLNGTCTVGTLTVTGTCTGCGISGVAWGAITGTLSSQTDLQSALNLKANLISPSFTTPNLGTPSAAVLTNATLLPISTGVSGLAAGIATFLATATSANLAAALSDETGSAGGGVAVFNNGPTLIAPALGTPVSGVMTNVTGTAAGLTAGFASASDHTIASCGANTWANGSSTAWVLNCVQPAFSNISGNFTLAQFPSLAANTALVNATAGSAVPTAFAMPSCSAAGSALKWTTSTGFGCNSSITATINANLTGPITSSGNATVVAAQTGTGSTFVMDTAPTVSNPIISGTITKYNGIFTAGVGIPIVADSATLTTQSASIGTTTWFTASATNVYRVCWVQQITQAATTSSSLLTTIGWNNGSAKTTTLASLNGGALQTTADASNALNSTMSGCVVLLVVSGQTVTYATTYASSGATVMQYSLRVTGELIQ